MKMENNFFTLLNCLSDAGVDFVLVGGFAGIVHGCTMVTEDIDICCDFSYENLSKLDQAIKDLNPVHRMTPKRLSLKISRESCTNLKNLYLDTDLGQLDCISYVSGVGDFEKVKRLSTSVIIGHRNLCILNLDALIDSKKAMNRPRDIQVAIQLEAIRKSLETKENE